MKNYCIKCGANVTSEQSFCSQCGNKISENNGQGSFVLPSKVELKNSISRVLMVLAIIFMPYIGIFLIAIKKPFTKKTNTILGVYCVLMLIYLFGTLLGNQSKNTNSNSQVPQNTSTQVSQNTDISVNSNSATIPTQEKKDNTKKDTNTLPPYKFIVEERVASLYNSPSKIDFYAFTEYRQWELDGLVYVENCFKVKGSDIQHRYLARCSKPIADEQGKQTITMYYLRIDGKKVYWDEKGEDEYLKNK